LFYLFHIKSVFYQCKDINFIENYQYTDTFCEKIINALTLFDEKIINTLTLFGEKIINALTLFGEKNT